MTGGSAALRALPERARIPAERSEQRRRTHQHAVRLSDDQQADLLHDLTGPELFRAGLTLLAASETTG